MIGPDGNAVPGGYTELEQSLIRRAAFERSVPERNIFLDYSAPSTHGGERWNVKLGESVGPGTDPLDETWSYWNKTYAEGLQRIAARDYVWVKPWQEDLRERIAYLPWDEQASWFADPDPQLAWHACPNGRHLFWVIGKDPTLPPEAVPVRACAKELVKLALASYDLSEHTLFDGETWVIAKRLLEDRASRETITDRYILAKESSEYDVAKGLERSWHFDRAVLFAALAYFGSTARLDDAAYHVGCLRYATWSDDAGEVQRALAYLVKSHFPQERFTVRKP